MGFVSRLRKKVYDFFFSYGGKSINNVSANYVFSPIYFFIVFSITKTYFKYPTKTSLIYSLISSLFYMYVSTFFQPDLDNTPHRPGKHSFPFGSRLIENFKFGKALRWLFKPVTLLWYYSWEPFAYLWTHRGVTHWPVIGVWLRVLWLYGMYLVFEWISIYFKWYTIGHYYFEIWLQSFFPKSRGFLSIGFFLFCFPVYISDIIHSSIDYIDSSRKGTAFCPPLLRRGLVNKIFNFIKNFPKIAKDFYSDFL